MIVANTGDSFCREPKCTNNIEHHKQILRGSLDSNLTIMSSLGKRIGIVELFVYITSFGATTFCPRNVKTEKKRKKKIQLVLSTLKRTHQSNNHYYTELSFHISSSSRNSKHIIPCSFINSKLHTMVTHSNHYKPIDRSEASQIQQYSTCRGSGPCMLNVPCMVATPVLIHLMSYQVRVV